MQKLFEVTLVLFLAIVSVVFLAILLTGLLSVFQTPLLAREQGITFVVTGVSVRRLKYLVLAATLLVCGVYLFWRRRRFHR